jgi:hypothetical protein
MSEDEDRRAIDRLVAGLPVEPDALATAITGKAVDRTVVVEALLKGLDDPEAVVRRRTARRVGRMADVAPRLAARLTVLAGSDEDDRSREASAAALRAHGLPVPGEPERDGPKSASAFPVAVGLLLRASVSRSVRHRFALAPLYTTDAPQLEVKVHEEHGELRLELSGLPPAFVATRPVLRARVAPAPEPLKPIGHAVGPVSAEGRVTIRVPLEGASLDDLTDWLTSGADLVVPGD